MRLFNVADFPAPWSIITIVSLCIMNIGSKTNNNECECVCEGAICILHVDHMKKKKKDSKIVGEKRNLRHCQGQRRWEKWKCVWSLRCLRRREGQQLGAWNRRAEPIPQLPPSDLNGIIRFPAIPTDLISMQRKRSPVTILLNENENEEQRPSNQNPN